MRFGVVMLGKANNNVSIIKTLVSLRMHSFLCWLACGHHKQLIMKLPHWKFQIMCLVSASKVYMQ